MWRTSGLIVAILLGLLMTACGSSQAALVPPCSLLSNSEASTVLGVAVVGIRETTFPRVDGQKVEDYRCVFSTAGGGLQVDEEHPVAPVSSFGSKRILVDGVTAALFNTGSAVTNPHVLAFMVDDRFVFLTIMNAANPQVDEEQIMVDILRHGTAS
jgi:phosphotransferase system  glucose/maltose/N-acetylglucosamine-specific IIC component